MRAGRSLVLAGGALAWTLGAALAATGTATGTAAGTPGPASETRLASLAPAAQTPAGELVLPEVLSAADIEIYRQLFEIQEDGEWRQADRLIKRLSDPLLLGHVLAQRYLHPRKYRSQYKELKAWLAAYADHPDTRRLHQLALRRKPANWRAPEAPRRAYRGSASAAWVVEGKTAPDINAEADTGADADANTEAEAEPPYPGRRMTRAQRRQGRAWERQVRSQLRHGRTKSVKQLLLTENVQKTLNAEAYDRLATRLAGRYFADGRDEWALTWAGRAAKRSGKWVPQAHWVAGRT